MDEIDALIARMTLDEKVAMMSGSIPFWRGLRAMTEGDLYHERPFPAAECARLSLEGLRFVDGPRGVVLEDDGRGAATAFPVSMARGASWDPELETRVGEAIGREVRAFGANLFGGVCVNLLRHPAWGRAQETYGEDPVHLSEMGAALVRGVEQHALATVKHYALNSLENARFQVDVRVSPRALHELYLPHFKACVEAGAGAVMSAYNSVNGEWAGQNEELLTGILRERWGFEGVVLTDFIFGMRDAVEALRAGQDLEMPFPMVWGNRLKRLVESGRVAESELDVPLRRLIRAQLSVPEGDYPAEMRGAPAHVELARDAARRGMVLLKNEGGMLPLGREARLVVLGELARVPNLGDHGSSDGRPGHVVTPLEGLRLAWSEVAHFDGLDAPGAREAVAAADAVVVVAGYTFRDEGEYIAPPDLGVFAPIFPAPRGLRWLQGTRLWSAAMRGLLRLGARRAEARFDSGEGSFGRGGDRTSLDLAPAQEAMIREASALNPRTVVAVMAGSAVMMERWRADPAAILMLWYPGQEGGHALADVLGGADEPGGRLPFVVPRDAAHLPPFHIDAREVRYDLWHGYRRLDRDGHVPAFPFGFGLGYTSWTLDGLEVARVGEELVVRYRMRNTGARAGAQVVQLYAGREASAVERAPRQLVGFRRDEAGAGETVVGEMRVRLDRLRHFDEKEDGFVLELGEWRFELGFHAGDPAALRTFLEVV